MPLGVPTRPFIGFGKGVVLHKLKFPIPSIHALSILFLSSKSQNVSNHLAIERRCPLESCEGQGTSKTSLCPLQPDVREGSQTSATFCASPILISLTSERSTTEMSRIFDHRQQRWASHYLNVSASLYPGFSIGEIPSILVPSPWP